MIGAIIGDIAGSRFEFNPAPTNTYNFALFSKECSFTDDTICTIAVADAILQGEDYGSAIHKWCRKYPDPMGGYGGSFRRWVDSDNPMPYGSYGNGAAMRVSAVAWAWTDRNEVLTNAKATAECTHNHPEGIKGAQTTALAIYLALQLRREGKPLAVEEIIEECANFSGYDLNIKESAVRNRFDETCQGTVPVALWIIRNSANFEEAVRKAVSPGADADTLGAIVGSIAEAIWGVPDNIAEKVLGFLPEEMKTVIAKFNQRF